MAGEEVRRRRREHPGARHLRGSAGARRRAHHGAALARHRIRTCYLRRGAGYYIETGASKKIIDGRIKLASGAGLAHTNERSVTLTSGATLPADLILFATGYGDMNQWAAQLISPEVAHEVGKLWGLGSATKYGPGPWEGELRNMWKPTKQEGLWFFGGNLMQARHYSIYVALQLKARAERL